MKNSISKGYNFIGFVFKNFIADDCFYRASALAFISLLAIVPLITICLKILAGFEKLNSFSQPILNYFFTNFLPIKSNQIQIYLGSFSQQASKSPLLGILLAFVTSTLLLITIEHSMNKIWKVNLQRRKLTAFILYWTILSLTPILLGLSLATSSYIFSLPLLKKHSLPLINYIPFLLSFLGFTFLYLIAPNTKVKLIHAFIGGILATILFENAKYAFAFFLVGMNTYQFLYGTFAIIPLFFIWVYWVWLITLLTAEVIVALAEPYQWQKEVPLDGFSTIIIWLERLCQAQKQGASLTINDLIKAYPHKLAVDPHVLLNLLTELKFIKHTHESYIILSIDLDEISIYDLAKNLPFKMPDLPRYNNTILITLNKFLLKSKKNLSKDLSMSLKKLYKLANKT